LSSDGTGRTFVVYFKLWSGPGLGATGRLSGGIKLNPSSPDGVVKVFCACAGVAARFGVGTGGNVRDPEGKEAVTEGGWFPGGEDDSDLGKGETEGADELNELTIGEGETGVGLVPVISGVGPQSWEGDGELCLPAVLVEVFEMGGEREGFGAPVGEAEEGPDSNAPETAGIGTLWAVEAPVECLLGPGGMEALVGFPVIGFLVNDQAFRSAGDQFRILSVLHGSDLDPEGGNRGGEEAQAILQVTLRDEPGMLACHEEEVAESERVEVPGFGGDLIQGEGCPQDGIVA